MLLLRASSHAVARPVRPFSAAFCVNPCSTTREPTNVDGLDAKSRSGDNVPSLRPAASGSLPSAGSYLGNTHAPQARRFGKVLFAGANTEAALVGELVEGELSSLAEEPVVNQRGLIRWREPSKHHDVVSHHVFYSDTACPENVAIHFGYPRCVTSFDVGIACVSDMRAR